MAEPSLQQVLGNGASQTVETLVIAKADLATVGLTASATNTAESLLAAIVLLAKKQLTDANQSSNPEQNITIDDGFPSLVTRNNKQYRQQPIALNLQKLDTASTINPDDY